MIVESSVLWSFDEHATTKLANRDLTCSWVESVRFLGSLGPVLGTLGGIVGLSTSLLSLLSSYSLLPSLFQLLLAL